MVASMQKCMHVQIMHKWMLIDPYPAHNTHMRQCTQLYTLAPILPPIHTRIHAQIHVWIHRQMHYTQIINTQIYAPAIHTQIHTHTCMWIYANQSGHVNTCFKKMKWLNAKTDMQTKDLTIM